MRRIDHGSILLHLRESYRHGKLNLQSKNTTTAATSSSLSVPHSDESNILNHVKVNGKDRSWIHPNTTTAASASMSVPHYDEYNILNHVKVNEMDRSRSNPFAS